MSKSIWAVTRGSYSDYRVLCICEDKATATNFANNYNSRRVEYIDEAEVEEFKYYPKDSQPKRITTYRSEAKLYDDRHVTDVKYWNYTEWEFETYCDIPPAKRPNVEYCRAPIFNNKGGFLRISCQDKESVAKATTERIAAFKSGSWIPQAGNHLEGIDDENTRRS